MAKKQRRPLTVCPDIPELIGVVGEQLVFVLSGTPYFLSFAGQMTEIEFPGEVDDASFGQGGVAFVSGSSLWRFGADGKAVGAYDLAGFDVGRVLPGWDAVVGIGAPEHCLVQLTPPTDIALPEGATRARYVAPFATGVGMVWVDLEQVYRMREGSLPAALGRAPKVQALAVGPDGCFVIQLEKDTLLAAPRGVAVRLGSVVDAESARFSPDGMRALALDEDGAVLVDLVHGKEIRRWDGDFMPIGFGPEPILLDGGAGAIVGADGSVLLARFCPPLQD